MFERCRVTHVVQCDLPGEHLRRHQTLGIRAWSDGDPQPHLEITPEQIERGSAAMCKAIQEIFDGDEHLANYLVLARVCLDAAWNEDTNVAI